MTTQAAVTDAVWRVYAPGLVGREDELAALGAALSRRPSVAVVEGEAGVGKTRLVSELRAARVVAGRRFVVGTCLHIREPFPLGSVIEAVRGVEDDLTPARLSPVAGALRPLLPEFAHILPPEPEPLDDRVTERHRVFRALVEVMSALGDVVLVLEDLHWADQQTIDFLGYLLSSPPETLSVLLTYRGEEVSPAVRALTAKLPGQTSHTQVVLKPLDATQTGALAASILGLDRVSEELATYLCERASGLPFAIEELLALMQARGTLVKRGGRWARKAIEELDVPAGVRDPVLERFSRMSEDARAVAEAAAVLQLPMPASALIATSGLDEPRALPALEEGLDSGLLADQDGAVGFRHLLAAQTVHEAIPRLRRQHLHARAATAIEALPSAPAAFPRLGQRAHHLRQAGRLDAWVGVGEEAADQAAGLGHDDEAARLLEDILRDASLDAEQRGRLALKLARTAQQLMHVGDDVLGLLSDALEQDLPRAVRGELRLRLAVLLERSGADVASQRPLLTAAIADLDDRPELQAHGMVALGIPCVPGVRLAEHQRWLRKVLDVVPEIDDPAMQVSLIGKVAMIHVAVGDPQWQQLADRIVERTGGSPRQSAEVNAYHSVGMNAAYAGHIATADRLLTAGLEGAVSIERRWLELGIRAALVLLDYCRGDWEGLPERADVLIDQLAGQSPGSADVEAVAGCLSLAQGDLDRASSQLAAVAERLEQQGGFDLLPIVAEARIRLALGRDQAAEAVDEARRFVGVVESVPLVVSAAWALPALSEALTAGGYGAEARTLVTRWSRRLRDLDAPLADGAVSYARGVLAAASGRWTVAAGEFRTAAERYEDLGFPYQAAQARGRAAIVLARSGDTDAADAELRPAVAGLQRLGASWDLDRTSHVARELGVSVPARHRGGRRGYGPDLSPRERQVADLVAKRLTNKEIADELFLSVKTVERHVSIVMRKLGVTSRRSIAGLLGDPQQPVADQ